MNIAANAALIAALTAPKPADCGRDDKVLFFYETPRHRYVLVLDQGGDAHELHEQRRKPDGLWVDVKMLMATPPRGEREPH